MVLTEQAHKRDLLSYIIRESGWHQVLVFTRTKHGANRLAEKLVKDGLAAAAIHGNKSQAARTRALAGFKDGTVAVLVATDIAARRSEEHTSELQSLMRISYAVFCLKKQTK